MKFNRTDISMRPLRPDPIDRSRSRKAVGEQSEAIITARFIEIGYHVLIPYGDNLRYDLIIEDANGRFWRIQCKAGHTINNEASITFSASSSYAHTRAGKAGNSHRELSGPDRLFRSLLSSNQKSVFNPY